MHETKLLWTCTSHIQGEYAVVNMDV